MDSVAVHPLPTSEPGEPESPADGLAVELVATAKDARGHQWVRAGDLLARVVKIPTVQDDVRITPGEGAAVNPGGDGVIATVDGRVVVENGRVSVLPGKIINGDLGLSSAKVEIAEPVLIAGNVADVCSVVGGASIQVEGVIDGADVRAATDLYAIGGISGKNKGHCRTGGNIDAKYIVNSNVDAEGAICAGMIAGSRVVCGGKLQVSGPILAGHVTSAGAVSCHAIGSPAGVATLIEVGICENLRLFAKTQLPAMQALERKSQKIRDTVGPLMRNPKALTPQQKERATELLFEADELQSRTAQMTKELKDRYDQSQSRCDGTLRVQEMLHRGVTIRFPGYSTTVDQPLKGPLKLLTRQIRGQTQVVIIYGENGAAHPLPTTKHDDDVVRVLHRLFQAATGDAP